MKNLPAWQRYKLHLSGAYDATKDTLGGHKEGLQEARVLKDYRARDIPSRWELEKAS